MSSYQKLVRDRIPEIIRKNGEVPVFEKLEDKAFKKSVKEKLVEEANELKHEDDTQKIIQELADVLEVAEAIKNAYGLDDKVIEKTKKEKRESRGGFKDRLYLKDVK